MNIQATEQIIEERLAGSEERKQSTIRCSQAGYLSLRVDRHPALSIQERGILHLDETTNDLAKDPKFRLS